MTTADLPLIVFVMCNALRIAAYFPQMLKLARHPSAAASFSHPTWALFAAANLSTAVYAGVVLGDTVLAMVNAIGAMCCGLLIGLAVWRCRCPVEPRAPAFDWDSGT
jgi:sorbitol-specific phosphotransferase system component IIC